MKLRFLDSLNFIPSSLDNLEKISENHPNISPRINEASSPANVCIHMFTWIHERNAMQLIYQTKKSFRTKCLYEMYHTGIILMPKQYDKLSVLKAWVNTTICLWRLILANVMEQ